MPDACSRRIDISEQLDCAPSKREMQTKNAKSPGPFHRKLVSPGPLATRPAGWKAERPAPVPRTGFSRDARGSLEIFGTSTQKGNTPVFSSPAWHHALETAENLLQKSDSPSRTESIFGDESETSFSEKGGSSLWKTKLRSQLPRISKSLPLPRALNSRAKATLSPVSITLEYGGSDPEFSLDNDSDDAESAVPTVSDSSAAGYRKVPLTPHNAQPMVAVFEAPVDIEERWRAMLNGTAVKTKRAEEFAENDEEEEEHWQGVLDGGVEDQVLDEEYGAESIRRMSLGASSHYSDDFRSERALQWGYEVPLTLNDHGSVSCSSWRTSTVSSESRSSGGSSTSSQTIPRVSKDVRDAITSFNLAFVVCDATGADPNYSVLYASGGFFKMTGYEADEVIGSNCRFLQGPGTSSKEVAKIRKALKAGESYSGRILNYKKDGTTFWNVLSISPIRDNDGKVIKYIGMQAEASEKKRKKKEEKAKVPETINTTETPKREPISKPAKPSQPAGAVKASKTVPVIPELSLPPLPKDAVDTLPKISYRYSLSKSRESNESAADWHALARLRAEIVSSARTLEAPGTKENEKIKESVPRTKRVGRLLRKLNNKFSERLRTPEVQYVDCEDEDNSTSEIGESSRERYRRSSVYSRSMDLRLATPSDFGKVGIPERAERLSSSHCAVPTVTHGGRSQFVIIH